MVGEVVRLKWRLLVNGVKTDRQRSIGLPLTVAGLLAGSVTLAIEAISTANGLDGIALREYSVWLATLIWVAWAIIPVLVFPLDETLDPARFALMPLTRTRLVAGLAGAGFVTPTVLIPLVALAVNVWVFRGLNGAIWSLAGSAVLMIHIVLAGLFFSALISTVVRSRRGRDLTVLIVLGLGLGVFAAQQVISTRLGELGMAGAVTEHPLSPWMWLIPPAGAQTAVARGAAGDHGLALVALFVSIAWIGVVGWLWYRVINHLVITPEAGGPAGSTRLRSFADRPFWSIVGVTARKELRYYVRDPRMRMVWTGAVIFLGILAASLLFGRATIGNFRALPALVLVSPAVVLFVGLPVALNQFGWERRAASFLFALPSQVGAVLVGKNLATTIALLIETAGMAVIAAWLTGGWRFLPWVPLIAVSAIGCQLAVGNLASVITPLRLPDMGSDVFSQSSEQGCLAIVSQLVSFTVMGLLMVPVAVAWVLVAWDPEQLRNGLAFLTNPGLVGAISVGWGAGLYAIGTWAAVRLLRRRLPEVLAWVDVA